MPYVCYKCGSKFYALNGKLPTQCPYCGSRLFKKLPDKKQTKSDAETLKIVKAGIYKINVDSLLRNQSNLLILKDPKGTYRILLNNSEQ
ncbi:MAG: FYDLN acid domain-containing protein [Candidatus Njordarchaeia archaeon]